MLVELMSVLWYVIIYCLTLPFQEREPGCYSENSVNKTRERTSCTKRGSSAHTQSFIRFPPILTACQKKSAVRK